jgi:hypothetical protein
MMHPDECGKPDNPAISLFSLIPDEKLTTVSRRRFARMHRDLIGMRNDDLPVSPNAPLL